MLTRLPGMFVAGEMIDWDAPTGGYLLTACFATGRAAADGIHQWLAQRIDQFMELDVSDSALARTSTSSFLPDSTLKSR